MKFLFMVVGVLSLIGFVFMWVFSKSAIHEILSAIFLVNGMLCMIGAVLTEIGGKILEKMRK